MNRTSIEWVVGPDGSRGYTWNLWTGCRHGCPYCYARTIANGQLKERYLANDNIAPLENELAHKVTFKDGKTAFDDPFFPRYWPERLMEPMKGGDAKGIFAIDMGEWNADWIPSKWNESLFNVIRKTSRHRYYLLTKQYKRLHFWSPFPPNVWVGCTATDINQLNSACRALSDIEATVKFISIEPMLEPMLSAGVLAAEFDDINWLIIGALTTDKQNLPRLQKLYPGLEAMSYTNKWSLQPRSSWVQELVEAADENGIPVFEKNNLKPLLKELRQEFPSCKD